MNRILLIFMAVLYCLSGSGCLPPETGPVVGKIFYLDPVAGSMDRDGSAAHPWASLEEVIAAGLIRTHAYADYPWDEDDPLYVRNPDGLVQAGDTQAAWATSKRSFWTPRNAPARVPRSLPEPDLPLFSAHNFPLHYKVFV